MTIIEEKEFAFAFDPLACADCGGRCCNGESGNIWVNRNEINAIAQFLKTTADRFISEFLVKKKYRYSIREHQQGDNYACIFYSEATNGCTIYDVRPGQCRTFPFWDYFRDNPGAVYGECPGCCELKKP